MSTYKDLEVWKQSYNFCLAVYKLSAKFPKEEAYGLTSQIRRAVVSIPSNISEGSKRLTKKIFVIFL
jgi:four helix bundle protein